MLADRRRRIRRLINCQRRAGERAGGKAGWLVSKKNDTIRKKKPVIVESAKAGLVVSQEEINEGIVTIEEPESTQFS